MRQDRAQGQSMDAERHDIRPTFGDLLRRYRLAAGLTQEELAERAGLSARGISDLERRARTNPQRETVTLLAEALALEPVEREAFVAVSRRRFPVSHASGSRSEANRSPDARVLGLDLPVSSDPLVGREHDIAAVTALVREATGRLVTLTGPGGVGKTRLAVQAANGLRDDFPDGVAFVPLASIRDPALVLPTVGQALGVREMPGRSPAEGLATVLHGRRALLVLDNLEQVLAAGPDVAGLLTACPNLHVLVTSRAALRLAGEQRYPVPPLAVPDASAGSDSYDFAANPAIRLFVRRARQAMPGFTLTPENAPAVAAICRRLDGIPLAIELATARVTVLPPNALLTRLERMLPLLAGGARDQPERLRTMRDAIAWSYDLLSPASQGVFRQLAVCAGGFSLEATETVCQIGDGSDSTVFDAVAELVEASLLNSDDGQGGEPRFFMLETIREFGLEQLGGHCEEAQARERHAAWVISFAERAESEMYRAAQQNWFSLVEAERPNIRAALMWLEGIADAERALRLAGSVSSFWRLRGYLREGQEWLRRALAIPGESSAASRAWALTGAASLAYFRGDIEYMRVLLEQSLAVSRQGQFALGVAQSQRLLATVAWEDGDLEKSILLGEQAIAGLRRAGHVGFLAIVLCDTGTTALLYGDDYRGRAWSDEGLAIHRGLGNAWLIAIHLNDLGLVAQRRGDLESAAQHFRESLLLFNEVRDAWYIASPLAGIAAIAATYDRPVAAARLLGMAAELREASGSAAGAFECDRDQDTADSARAALGEDEFARAMATGRKLPLAQAVEEAIAIIDDLIFAEVLPTG